MEFQKQIENRFIKYKWDKIKLENLCDNKNDKKLKLNNTQQFVTEYFSPNNKNGMFLWHSVGSGKTLSAVSIVKKFQDLGYNALWVTRTTLKQDINKALEMLPLNKKLTMLSYKQFSNIAKRKGESYTKLIQSAKKLNQNTEDPLYKTVVIIDEAHKLYTKDLKPQEMHNIGAIQGMIHDSYDKSGKNALKLVLMSATPITADPLEIVKLFNLIIENPQERFETKTFKAEYLNEKGDFKKDSVKDFQTKIKDLVSYIDMSKDPRKFAQVKTSEIFVPMSTPRFSKDFDQSLKNCNNSFDFCKSVLKLSSGECKQQLKSCKDEISENKKIYKNSKYQVKMLKEKCNMSF